MRKNIISLYGVRIALVLLLLMGCARVRFESKDPIKVDVTMRLDIYQHVAKDVAAIEDLITSGSEKKDAKASPKSLSWLGVAEVYAQDDLEGSYPSDVQAAIERRKARRQELLALESEGAVGENALGFVVVKKAGAASLVEEENNDRRMIYQYVASKNQAGVDNTGRVFAKRIQEDAPQGTPLEGPDGQWRVK
jgi:uncharacterized protein YdbL (DUF1318 family)